jgi:cobalt-zinc-cadmium efflux system membrane fusion protein
MKTRLWITIVVMVIAGVSLTSMVLLNNTEADKEDATTEYLSLQVSGNVDVLDWCAEHDLPESHCRLCNPEIEFPQELSIANSETGLDWCVEHSVPESECTQCNPALIDQYKASDDWCAGHDLPESHCRLCNPEIEFPQEKILVVRQLESTGNNIEVSLFFRSNKNVCATNDALIQFASSTTADRSGITVHQAIAAPYETELEAPAEILFDENSTVVISSAVKVLVSRWLISPGDVVTKGDPIAILQSSEMAELQARLMSAYAELVVQKKELDRDKALISGNLVSESDFERRIALNKKAKAELTSLRGLLLSSGISDRDIDELLENETVTNEFVLRAPGTGVIAKRIAQVGELLEDGQALAILTDPTSLWIEAQLTEDQIKNVYVGQDLLFASDDGALNRVKGTIIWVSPYLDSHTRTGIVRARVVNQAHNLRSGEFGQVTILNTHDSQAILVPKDAVQWEGCCNVVFVRESLDRFRPRKVELADGPGSYYQVTSGLLQGEEIVIDGSFLLKTELKKTSIGAGCCDVGPVG